MTGVPLLTLSHITKRYPGVLANDRISLSVLPGEIHAVLGENGAGKSTLMKIAYGMTQPDAGEIIWNGSPVRLRSPQEARALGIAMVFQHFNLFDSLTVAENVALGLDSQLPLAEVANRIATTAAAYGLDIQASRPVHTLSVGEMQRVEIIRALLADPQLLIMDEPTSVLAPQAAQKLFNVLRRLAEEGRSILYISHKLDEIRVLCTACTVLRAGRVSGECNPRKETHRSLARLMIGTEPRPLTHSAAKPGAQVLQVASLFLPSAQPFGVDLENVSFNVQAGEVVGLAGVSGNGQRELFAVLSGEDRRAPTASVCVAGESVTQLGPGARRARGIHTVPEERLGRAAVPSLGLAHNLLLTRREALGTGGWIRTRQLARQAQTIVSRFHVQTAGVHAAAQSLSGGNLQKFIVGREIEARPRLLVVAQPTWGVDVGAAAQIRSELLALRNAGCAVLVISEDLDELFELSDRLYVMARGRLSPELLRAEADMVTVGKWMSGLWDRPSTTELSLTARPSTRPRSLWQGLSSLFSPLEGDDRA